MDDKTELKRQFAAQLPSNLISNIAFFLINILIAILLIPYFLSTLGVAAYGLIPLASSITGYANIVVTALNQTVSRFLTIDLQRNDFVTANRTFNTSFFILLFIIFITLPIVLLIVWFLPVIFNIPAGQETGARFLVLSSSLVFFIGALTGTYTVQLFAYNRLDLRNLVSIIGVLLEVGLIVLFFSLWGPSLILIGLAYIVEILVTSVIAIVLAKRVCAHLYLSIHSFDRSRVKDLGEMGVWVFIDRVGTLLFLQIDLIVVNILFGPTLGGEYAIVLKWGNTLQSVAGVLGGVLIPMTLTYYAKGYIEDMLRYLKSSVKLMGLALALPVGLICGLSPYILTVWVGAEYAFLAPLMILMCSHTIINLGVMPLFSINTAYNRVRIPGLVTVVMGIGNFVLAVVLSLYTGWGYYGVAAAGAIVLTTKNLIFTPWYATRVLGISAHTFTRFIINGVVAGTLLASAAAILGFYFRLNALIPLIVAGGILATIYIALMWRFALSAGERKLFSSYLPEKIQHLVQ